MQIDERQLACHQHAAHLTPFLPLQHTRNRSSYVNDGFRLLDKGNKGYISANDVQQLSQEVGKHPVSYAQAKRMVQHCSQDEGIVVDQKDFAQLLSPPEP